jgi:hypothetical protein
MSYLELKYHIETDTSNGLAIVMVTGRCTQDEVHVVEGNCTRRYSMVTLPNASGAVLKSLDGTLPMIVMVTPSTMPTRSYRCVKVDGRCNPHAYQQAAGPYAGYMILTFMIRYQEVGGVA